MSDCLNVGGVWRYQSRNSFHRGRVFRSGLARNNFAANFDQQQQEQQQH